jgi:hypothetical protein
MPITINGNGTITGASTLATAIASPTFTTPNIDSAQFATVSGTAPIYACRAWVNFNGTGTVAIRASGNVSSITDNSTANYTVNFTTSMPDANYALASSMGPVSNMPEFFGIQTAAVSSCTVGSGGIINQYAGSDKAIIGLAFFR